MKIVIAGGGLVGLLAARIFGQQGHEVHVFDYRDDPRKGSYTHGRSINLALSKRGRTALRVAGLEDAVMKCAIPMRGRMLHGMDGSTKSVIYDPEHNECVYSVNREFLITILLNEAESCPNVRFEFNHKFIDADLVSGIAKFTRLPERKDVEIHADLILGADGAYSVLRKRMIKKPMINFSQTYIEHGYMELSIPPDSRGQYSMETNYLHIWPRDRFMLIALPNQDASFTATLFMPFQLFNELASNDAVEEFFKQEFPDALELMGRDAVVKAFKASAPSSLLSIKCNPHHFARGVLVGDAAHAMVPFYGQGMNAGFEDILILNNILQRYSGVNQIEAALEAYSKERIDDTHAICDLAMYNYIEMRHLVNQKSYHWRRNVDWALHKILGTGWIPFYNSVTFTNLPYSQCVAHKKWQDEILENCKNYASKAVSGCVLVSLFFWQNFATLLPGGGNTQYGFANYE